MCVAWSNGFFRNGNTQSCTNIPPNCRKYELLVLMNAASITAANAPISPTGRMWASTMGTRS